MITLNVISRTYHLKFGSVTGTCFTIDIEGRQYFVTAKHVVENLKSGDEIELFYKNTWLKTNAILIGHSTISDVSVFAIDFYIFAHPLTPSAGGMSYGQDLYFLGFPYGISAEIGVLNRDFPLPLVKKGIFSAIFFEQPGKMFLIDGHNNPGFSGGPVVFKHSETNEFNVAGVISAYRYELEPAYINDSPTEIKTRLNTGIIIAYSISNALDLVKENPSGTLTK